MSDPQMVAPPRHAAILLAVGAAQFFADRFMLYHNNADENGAPWNTASVLGGLGDADAGAHGALRIADRLQAGTRHAKSAVIETVDPDGGKWRAELTHAFHFYMSGIGYGHPEWGHGMYRGDNALGYDTLDLASVNENDPRYQHIQALVERAARPDRTARARAPACWSSSSSAPSRRTASPASSIPRHERRAFARTSRDYLRGEAGRAAI